MNTLAYKCFVLLLALASLTPDQSSRLENDLEKSENAEQKSFLVLVRQLAGEPASREIERLLEAGDTLTTEAFLLNILNSNPGAWSKECLYYSMLTLFQLEIKRDTAIAKEFSLLTHLHSDSEGLCERSLLNLGGGGLASLAVSEDSNLVRKAVLIHNLLDTIFGQVYFSPRVEICLTLDRYCDGVPDLIDQYKRISKIDSEKLETLLDRVNQSLPKSKVRKVPSKTVAQKRTRKTKAKNYDHIPDYHPPTREITASAKNDLSEKQIAVMLLEDEKRRYRNNHKTLEGIFYSCLFNYKVKRDYCSFRTKRISKKDLGLSLSMSLRESAAEASKLESACVECFVNSLNRFSRNNKIVLAKTATRINVNLPQSGLKISKIEFYRELSKLEMSSANIRLKEGQSFTIQLTSPDFFRKDYASHVVQIQRLQERIDRIK